MPSNAVVLCSSAGLMGLMIYILVLGILYPTPTTKTVGSLGNGGCTSLDNGTTITYNVHDGGVKSMVRLEYLLRLEYLFLCYVIKIKICNVRQLLKFCSFNFDYIQRRFSSLHYFLFFIFFLLKPAHYCTLHILMVCTVQGHPTAAR